MIRVVMLWSVCLLTNANLWAQQIRPGKLPNIIFILTDDLGYGDVGIYYKELQHREARRSGPHIVTPHLDYLAENGAYLTDHYAAAPVCAPSRASILTGRSQGHASVRNNQFDKAIAENYTFATLLQHKGYQTAAIGKWGLQGKEDTARYKNRWPSHPLDKGFDYFLGYIKHVDGHEHYPKEGLYRGRKTVWENTVDITDGLDLCYTGDLWTAAAKRWIIQQKNTPFCLFLAYDTPHAVLELPTSAYPQGGGLYGGLQWLGKKGKMINTARGKVDSWTHPDIRDARYDHDGDPNTVEVAWPETYQRYATSVRRIDDGVGDILRLLKDLDIDQHTLIVFTSDNGPSLESYLPKDYVNYSPEFFQSFGPFDGVKRDVLEGGLRVPLIAYWPDQIKKGTVIRKPSISYDWLPTLVESAGMDIPSGADGVSLLPILTGRGDQKESRIYVEYQVTGKTPDYASFDPNNRNRRRDEMQMIRMGDTVAIRYQITDADADFELYDVSKDPGQTTNLKNIDNVEIQRSFKAFALRNRRADVGVSRPYDDMGIPPVVKGLHQRGLWAATSSKVSPWLSKSKAIKKNRITDFNKDVGIKEGQISLTGYLNIPKAANYRFVISSSNRITLRIHAALCLDKDYEAHKKDTSFSIKLEQGIHPIQIDSDIVKGKIPFRIFMDNGGGLTELSAMDFFCQ